MFHRVRQVLQVLSGETLSRQTQTGLDCPPLHYGPALQEML